MQTFATVLRDENVFARQFAQSLSEEEIFQLCQTRYVPMFGYPSDHPLVFIKYGRRGKEAEGGMQRLAFDWLTTHHDSITVPEVYKIFTRGLFTFIVMEFVEAKPILEFAKQFEPQYWNDHQSYYYNMIIEGIELLRRMPVPSGTTPGPYSKSERIMKHMIFKDQEAPIQYDTVGELEDHLNRVSIP